MASPTKVSDFHIRGMTDVGGTPTATIDTIAVEQWSDGTIRWVRATPGGGESGDPIVVKITDQDALRLLADALNINLALETVQAGTTVTPN